MIFMVLNVEGKVLCLRASVMFMVHGPLFCSGCLWTSSEVHGPRCCSSWSRTCPRSAGLSVVLGDRGNGLMSEGIGDVHGACGKGLVVRALMLFGVLVEKVGGRRPLVLFMI